MMKTIIKILFPAVLTAGMLLPASAQQNTGTPMKLTLDQAIKYDLENNANIKNAKIDLESAKKKIWETTAQGLPQVNTSANYQNIFKVPVVNFGPSIGELPLGVQQNVTINVVASQLIFS